MPTLPPRVAELLEPISSDSPAGAELDLNVPGFSELEAEIQKASPSYANCIAWAATLLKSKSKHLRVAAWLAFAWYRHEKKLAGLQNGMLLLAELLERYSGKLFPANPQEHSKCIQFLRTERVTSWVAREACTGEEAQAALAAFQHLVSVCAKHFPQNGPVLTALGQALENLAKSPSSGAASQKQGSGEQSSVVSEQSLVVSDQSSGASEQFAVNSSQHPASSIQQPEPQLEIPEHVAELLRPISESAPAGRDVTKNNEEGYQEYLALQSESNKITPNYDVCTELAARLLKDNCKSLEVMVWLTFAWFRKRKITGLKDGSLLMLNALTQFGGKLFPEDGVKRSRCVNFLNRKDVAKILAKEQITASDVEEVFILQKAWLELEQEYLKQFAAFFKKDQVSPFREIGEVINAHAEEAKEKKEKEKGAEQDKSAKNARLNEGAKSAGQGEGGKIAPGESGKKSESGGKGGSSTITSNDGALAMFKQALRFFFEEEKGSEKTRKVPDEPFVYALSRQLCWSKLRLPEMKKDNPKVALKLKGPTSEKQAALNNWMASGTWDSVIPDIETRFLQDESFCYWLDTQRYVVQALEAKGGKWNPAAQEIKFQLARLIQRLPELPALLFADQKTPFADKATNAWLEDEVRGTLNSGKGKEKILPPIMGEEYEAITQEYEAACAELPENFEKHVGAMQSAIAGDIRRKGKFLRGLNLANYCLAAKKPELAKALLADLMKKVEAYQLAEWEPALCTAVWQAAYLANLKLLQSDNHAAAKVDLQAQQNLLFDQIGKYDCLRALELASRQPSES